MKKRIYFAYLNLIRMVRAIAQYLFHKLNNVISYLFKSTYSEVRGHTMFLDLNDTNQILSKMREDYSLDLISNYIKEDDTVIDVGACIGMFTLEMAKLVGVNGRVIAFEPLKEGFNILEKNIQINNYEGRVKCYNKAILNKTGKGNLFYHPYHIGASVMYDEFEGREKREVDITTLDNHFKDTNNIFNLIKIDADGSEYFILQGAKEVLSKTKALLIEFAIGRIIAQGVTPKEFLDLIKSYGFKIYLIDDEKRKLESGELEHLIMMLKGKEGLGNSVNLLCIK